MVTTIMTPLPITTEAFPLLAHHFLTSLNNSSQSQPQNGLLRELDGVPFPTRHCQRPLIFETLSILLLKVSSQTSSVSAFAWSTGGAGKWSVK